MKRAKLAGILRKDYVQTAILVVIMVVSVIAFWYGLKFAFKTEHPLLAVASGSMEPVLYRGDLILVQGVHNACKINAAPYPDGDIIIFHRPGDPSGELIVHRAVGKFNENGHWYIRTQGDAVGSEDPWQVEESDIVGEYTGAKAPLLGHIALFFEPLQVKVAFIMLWIILLIILEMLPLSRKRVKEEPAQTKPFIKRLYQLPLPMFRSSHTCVIKIIRNQQ